MSKEVTLFPDVVKKYMPFAGAVSKETLNDDKVLNPPYWHKLLLREEYSADLTWKSKSFNNVRVKADIVALDSPLPVKRRPSLGAASGEIVKSGMKKWIGEKEIMDIEFMISQGVDEAEIARKLFDDINACRDGIEESNEYNFLKALYGGAILIPDEDHPGLGIRIEFEPLEGNIFGVVKKWSNPEADTINDIERVVAKANEDGNTIVKAYTDRATYRKLRNSFGVKRLHAQSEKVDISIVGNPTNSQFQSEFYDEFGFDIQVIDRSVRSEINGIFKNEKPFGSDKIVFVCSDTLGRLVYGTLAEEKRPVNGVEYAKYGSFILLSKYSENDPLREYSSSQALVLPVLDNMEQVYYLNTEEAQELDDADKDAEDDENITIWGQELVKADVIAALNDLGYNTSPDIKDSSLIAKINKLSDEDEAKLKTALEVE